jgi:hypothetical protein
MKHAAAVSRSSKRQLDEFEPRCSDIVERIDAGLIAFIDGVDTVYSAAVWSGLSGSVGDDAVQAIMARAFDYARFHRK